MEKEVQNLYPPCEYENIELYGEEKLDAFDTNRNRAKSIRPTRCYSWEFNHVGNNLDRNGREMGTQWEKLSLPLNFILDTMEMNDGPKSYRYLSKGKRGYIADIKNMVLVRLGDDNKPLKAWEMR